MMTSPEPTASSLLPPAASPELVASIQHALALKDLLEQEFEALRAQDLDAFEAMQARKLEIFEILNALTRVGTPDSLLDDPDWDGFKQMIMDCRELHRRNEVLISRKLDAIKGTLNTLDSGYATAAAKTYVKEELVASVDLCFGLIPRDRFPGARLEAAHQEMLFTLCDAFKVTHSLNQ